VGDRVARAWRAVRDGSRDDPHGARSAGATAGRGRTCGASGWPLRSGCTDGDGGTICPVCSRPVRTVPHRTVARGVEVIEAHGA
jgi:hypothetical protein